MPHRLVLCSILLAVFAACPDQAAAKTAIASAHPLATDAGFEIIEKGGNVFDAAVAVSAVLAVAEPASSGLGGGGYWLLHRNRDDMEVVIDGREKAPMAAHEAMFLDKSGKVIPQLSLDGALAAAIPGLPAALVHLSEKYGKLPLSESLKPAIRHAKNGFAVSERHRKMLTFRLETLQKNPAAASIFLSKGKLPQPFSILKQPDLADTLTKIAESGREGFYEGELAGKLVDSVRRMGGIWTKNDLAGYRIIERAPIKGRYQGITLTSAPPSSSGGIALMEALNILSGFDVSHADKIARIHWVTEAMRRAYHDRALYLGDPDFTYIPVERLLSADYAAGLSSTIRPDRALPSEFLSGDLPDPVHGQHTTHFSIIDDDGNRVAATLSINRPFGAGIVAEGTGVVLNDEMDDFSARPGALNGYGLVGGAANAIAPGKRMLSSMTPTFLETKDRIGVLGTPGGSRIISMVLLGVLDFAEGHPPASWVGLPRYHHQYIPDVLEYEPGALTDREIADLTKLGHDLTASSRPYGDMQAVQMTKSTRLLSAASDPRGEGKAAVKP